MAQFQRLLIARRAPFSLSADDRQLEIEIRVVDPGEFFGGGVLEIGAFGAQLQPDHRPSVGDRLVRDLALGRRSANLHRRLGIGLNPRHVVSPQFFGQDGIVVQAP